MPYKGENQQLQKFEFVSFSTESFSFDSAFPADTTFQTFQVLQHIPRPQARHKGLHFEDQIVIAVSQFP
jgi:hypothetical protein